VYQSLLDHAGTFENVRESWREDRGSRNRRIAKRAQDCLPERNDAQEVEGESLQKSLQSGVSKGASHRKTARKPLKRIGSPSWTRFEL
jgi:hypothetical protein